MTSLLVRNVRVLTLGPDTALEAEVDTVDLCALPFANVLMEDGKIVEVSETKEAESPAVWDKGVTLDARGRVLMPAFVDCHTHACWAGNRLDEWQAKLRGASYLELLKAGGGIMSTVRMVRDSSEAELAEMLTERLDAMLREGTTTAEVKSGYGLNTETELKMLRAIHEAGRRWPGRLVATACIGHAVDPACQHR